MPYNEPLSAKETVEVEYLEVHLDTVDQGVGKCIRTLSSVP